MKNNSLVAIIGVVIIAIIGFFFFQAQVKQSTTVNQSTQTGKETTTTTVSNYSGQVIAGSAAPFLVFNQGDYQKALAENKIVFLDFYANWCPTCRAEAPDIEVGFNELTTDQVVGFRVNYNDSETDENEKALAQQFEIPYQHHKVILKNGQQVLKDGEVWDKQKFVEEISKFL